MSILLWVRGEHDDTGQFIGLVIRYRNNNGVAGSGSLSSAEINGKTPAEILVLAKALADADSTIAGTVEREDILENNIKKLLAVAETEIAYLDENIPIILTLTTVAQLRVAVDRLARENRVIIKALIRLINSH